MSDKITRAKATDLKPDLANANRHTERGVRMVHGSIEVDGFRFAGTLDKNNYIVHGNNRHEQATDIGLEDVVILDADPTKQYYLRFADLDLTDPDNRARILAYQANRSAQVSIDFDPERVLADLDSGVNLKQFWSEGEFTAILAELGQGNGKGDSEPQIDKAAELQKKWGTRLGQVWALGEHRVGCLDSTDKQSIAKLFNGKEAVLFATDPPYGSNAGNIGFTAQRDDIEAITKDDLEGLEMQAFLESVFRVWMPHLANNCAWYLWHPMLTQGYFAAAAAAADLVIHRQIIWRKDQFIFGRGDYHWRHELCFYGWRKGNRPNWHAERNQDTVWEIPYDVKRSEIGHPTPKPVELFLRPIRNHTQAGEICAEPFLGSGSQLIACEQSGRVCIGADVEPKYIAVSIQRWADLTGHDPVLLSDQ